MYLKIWHTCKSFDDGNQTQIHIFTLKVFGQKDGMDLAYGS